MAKVQIITKQTTEHSIEIEIPLFLKRDDGILFFAVFGESKIIKVYNTDNYTNITSANMDLYKSDIAEAYHTWLRCDELEFRRMYLKALKTIMPPGEQSELSNYDRWQAATYGNILPVIGETQDEDLYESGIEEINRLAEWTEQQAEQKLQEVES